MGNPTGFLEYTRETFKRRDVKERIKDWKEVNLPFPEDTLRKQASRCMDCGTPFCHTGIVGVGCPIYNLIPEWNDLVYRGHWEDAIERLHDTNNFPEFTGRICPAPCESSCVLAIHEPPVAIKQNEVSIIERAWSEGWVKHEPPKRKTGKKIAVIGSGPAGLACAQQLTRVGHEVTVYERADRIGGLLVYGIPEFKMEKYVITRRLAQMEEEGTKFVTNANVGDNVTVGDLRKNNDALVLCGGATKPRDLNVPGRELSGIYFAMEYLTQSNRVQLGDTIPDQIQAADKNVVIIGGGDTGADCLGTAIRQGAKSIKQFELLPRPPDVRASDNPWPQWDRIFRTSSAHEEMECRDFSINTKNLEGESGILKKLNGVRLEWIAQNSGPPQMKEVEGSEFVVDADLILLAMGFVGPETNTMIEQLGVELTDRGNVKADANKMTNVEGVFAAGDMARGQSLVVWAIREGRDAAREVDKFLMGETSLP